MINYCDSVMFGEDKETTYDVFGTLAIKKDKIG